MKLRTILRLNELWLKVQGPLLAAAIGIGLGWCLALWWGG